MLRETVSAERRRFKRYTLTEPVLIMGKDIVGLIRDISCGGCSFQYVEKQPVFRHEDSLALEPLGMGKIAVQTVKDSGPGRCFAGKPARMRTRRVEFTRLTRMQLRRLEQFLRTANAGALPPAPCKIGGLVPLCGLSTR